jgi:hypothetical protein
VGKDSSLYLSLLLLLLWPLFLREQDVVDRDVHLCDFFCLRVSEIEPSRQLGE